MMINLSCDCADRHPTHHYSYSTLFFTTICAYFPHIWTTYPQSHRNHLKTTSWMHVTKDCIKTGGERADPLQRCLKNYLNMDNLAIYTCCVNCVHLSFHCSPSLLILVCLPLQIIAFSLPTLKAISFRNCPELFCPFWWWSKTAEAFGELEFVIQVQSQMQLRDIGFARLTDWGLFGNLRHGSIFSSLNLTDKVNRLWARRSGQSWELKMVSVVSWRQAVLSELSRGDVHHNIYDAQNFYLYIFKKCTECKP